MTENEPTPEERLAQLDAERERVLAEVKARQAEERPKALDTVLRLIATHGITKAELEPALRKRKYKVRGPRKPKAPPVGPNAGVTDGMSSAPMVAKLGIAA